MSVFAGLVLSLALAADDPRAAVSRGLELQAAGRYAEAVAAFDQAVALGLKAPIVNYRRAQALSRAGRVAEAAAALEAALKMGFGALAMAEQDPELAALRADAAWPKLREGLDRNMRPCAYDAAFRALDFWVGEWDVTGAGAPPGVPAARSVIEKVEADCVVQETYTTALGYSGRSLNLYDRETKRWEQFWVDNKGGLHHYRGEARDGNLYYVAEAVRLGPPGTPLATVKMTFFDKGPDEVRQLMEQSTDGGKTWTVAFDGTYRRRKP